MPFFRRPGVALATLLFLLTGAAFLTQVVPYRQIIDSQRQMDESRQELAALEAENHLLREDVDALNMPEEIERLAREKLGYVRPGETAYVVLDPPDERNARRDVEPAPEVEPKTWVDRVWEFVSGGDIASDG